MPLDGTPTPDAGGDESIESLLGFGEGQTSNAAPTSGGETTSQPQQGNTATGEFEFAGRKFKSREEAEKTWKSMYGEFSKNRSRAKQLEEMIRNPSLAKAVSSDPELSEIASKLGLELLEAEAEEAEQGRNTGREGETASPEIRALQEKIELMEYRSDLKEQRSALEAELKRPLTEEEKQGIRSVIETAPTLGLREAYRLATYDQRLKEARESAAKEAASRGGKNRPAPIPGILPGQKMDLKKPVHTMSRAEFREDAKAFFRNAASEE